MPSTVLGKRSRVTVADSTANAVNAKRRITINGPNDENENPFITHGWEDNSQNVVELGVTYLAKTKGSSSRSVPSKRGGSETRTEFSPAKTEPRSEAIAVDVYHDDRLGDLVPKTPRHRDSCSKKVPITPRHRIVVAGCKLTPRSPKTPRTPSHESTAVYNQARLLFSRCSGPESLVGRKDERAELSTFTQSCVASKSGGCLYVSGPPGTGKSAFVAKALEGFSDVANISVSTINCMSVRNTKDLSLKLAQDLEFPDDADLDDLQSVFIRGKARDCQKYIVILDEVDRLVDLDLSLLYRLFEWSMHANSRLILIGIANALDLTDRFLPRLKSRNLKPQLLPFMPYTALQIAEVITSKLKSLCTEELPSLPFMQPAAIQFCAKKVAAQTGDLRKAFDICRRAIDLVEQETRTRDEQSVLQNSPSRTPLTENFNLSSPPTPYSPSKKRTILTRDTAPKVSIAHMARITAQIFSNGTTQRLGNLNLQQKAVLCALAALEKHTRDTAPPPSFANVPSTPSKRPTAPSIKQLFEAYSSLCRLDGGILHPLSSVEFRDIVSGLETLTLLAPAGSKFKGLGAPITPSRTPGRKSSMPVLNGGDDRRFASVVGGKELMTSLEGPGSELLKEILETGL